MPVLLITLLVALGAKWQAVGGQLLASGVFLLSGYQDSGSRPRGGAFYWFIMAMALSVSALVTAIRAGLWAGSAICVVVLCFEGWLVVR